MENDEADDILKEIDADGSGQFKYEEYVKEKLKDKIKKWSITTLSLKPHLYLFIPI